MSIFENNSSVEITDSSKPNNKKSITDSKETFKKIFLEVQTAKKEYDSKEHQRSPELLNKLASLYNQAAFAARDVSLLTKDDEEKNKYEKYYIDLANKAQEFGSTIQRIPKTTIEDVKGLNDVKEVVNSFIFSLKNQELMNHYKIDGGMGLLMYGAPGTGKTMFAEAIANAMGLPLFVVTPADIFKSYVGESEQAVKYIFESIDACPEGAILFIDECESIFSKRDGQSKDYKAAVTTELLQRMNGFGKNGQKRIMVAATNRPDVIDSAYLRYKRFSHLVHITHPDMEAKRSIIESKLKGIDLEGITIDEIAQMTKYTSVENSRLGSLETEVAFFSAADICGVIEDACRIAFELIQERGIMTPIPLTRSMFEKAFSKAVPSISSETNDFYKNFKKNAIGV